MRKIIELLMSFFMSIWSRIYTIRMSQRITNFRNVLYSMWIRHFLGKVGEDTGFGRPLVLQGGGQRNISIGSHTSIGHHTVLGCWKQYGNAEYEPEIIIGSHCTIGEYCHFSAIRKITIGDGLLTGRFVYIGDNAHGGLSWEEADIPPLQRQITTKGEVRIGRNVWIGDKVTILGGVTIGDNVIIGANTVVTKDVPSNTVVAGCNCRLIKSLDDALVK